MFEIGFAAQKLSEFSIQSRKVAFGHLCQRRCKSLPLGRSKSRPVCAAPWGVMPSSSKHVPRRVGRQADMTVCWVLARFDLL